MPNKQKSLNTLVFVISSGSGDGSIVCFEKVSKEIHDYFIENDLSLVNFALDSSYAKENNIPEEMEPFNPGYSATFGFSETGMTASDDLELFVTDEKSETIFSGNILKRNIKKDDESCDSINSDDKGVYAVGYEGLEDCYIEGKIEIEEDFDIKKFKVFYCQFDYKSIEATLITKITYDQKEVNWEIDSYEGTGDNSFEFVVID